MPVTVNNYPSALPYLQDIVPVAVPTSSEDVATEDVYLDYALFNATSGTSSVTVTLTDKQGSPQEIFRIDVTDKGPVQVNFQGRRCPGGLSWVASASGIVGYLRWRK